MFEVSLLMAATIMAPPGKIRLIWVAALFFVALPGMYAMLRGAPFVPTGNATIRRMIKLARIKKGEKACDLGCGDGRIVFAAAAAGADAIGYELSLPTFLFGWLRSLRHKGSRIRCRDFWREDLSRMDVVFCYLLVGPMKEFQHKIWPTLKPGCRVVSHAFSMPDIQPDGVDQDAKVYIKH